MNQNYQIHEASPEEVKELLFSTTKANEVRRSAPEYHPPIFFRQADLPSILKDCGVDMI